MNGNYNTREEILACSDPLSFDGIYLNVWENRDVLKGKDVILYVMGNYVGKDNSFDKPMPLEKYCDWNQIMDLVVNYGCKLGWHTWSHPDLRTLSDEELAREVKPPFPMESFAYPYGYFDERVIKAVKAAGFKEAVVVFRGDNSPFQKLRTMIQ